MDIVRYQSCARPILASSGSTSTIDPSSNPRSFRDVFHQLAREVDRGERVVHAALSMGSQEDDARGMIALQAGVYRYVEAIELCAKLVDRTASAVKTTLQSQ